MTVQTWSLYDASHASSSPRDELPTELSTRRGVVKLHWHTIHHGPGAGVDMLTVSGTRAGFTVLPTRGMSLWRCWNDQTTFGWKSPIQGPIHPRQVPLFDPSGIGWLEGFDEFLVRCGLESNGAPEFDEHHRIRWPLHGRIANLPAHACKVSVNTEEGWIEVTGIVREARLFFANLVLTSTIRMRVDGHVLEITDHVSNESARDAVHQLLYHINFGKPVLDEGTRLLVAAKEVAPKDAHAAKDIQTWETYRAPQTGYAEQVYFVRPQADDEGWGKAVAVHPQRQNALGIEFHTSTLPWFVQWKNTAAEADGYVTGLEPSTNFPNTRSFEEQHGRVVRLPAGASVSHRLRIHLLHGKTDVDEFEQSVRRMGAKPEVRSVPNPDWSM